MYRTIKTHILFGAGWMFLLFSSCSPSPKDIFEKNALELNRSCPIMIDSYTQMDSAGYEADKNIFRHYYTLHGEKDNPQVAGQEQQELLQRITEFIMREPAMSTHRRYHITMEYIYRSSSSGDELFRLKITPDMYQ